MRGEVVLIDSGVLSNEVESMHYSTTVKTSYSIDVDNQLLSYTVTVNGITVREANNTSYSYEKLHNAALEEFYRNMYKGLPNLTLNINEGAY